MPKIPVCWRMSRDIWHHGCWTCSLRSCRTTLIVPMMGMMVVFRTQLLNFQFAGQLLPGLHLVFVISWYPHVYKECDLLLLDCEIWPVTDDGAVCYYWYVQEYHYRLDGAHTNLDVHSGTSKPACSQAHQWTYLHTWLSLYKYSFWG